MGWLDKVEEQKVQRDKARALREIQDQKQAIIKDAEVEGNRLEFMEAKIRYHATVEALMLVLKEITTVAEITAERARRRGIYVRANAL